MKLSENHVILTHSYNLFSFDVRKTERLVMFCSSIRQRFILFPTILRSLYFFWVLNNFYCYFPHRRLILLFLFSVIYIISCDELSLATSLAAKACVFDIRKIVSFSFLDRVYKKHPFLYLDSSNSPWISEILETED